MTGIPKEPSKRTAKSLWLAMLRRCVIERTPKDGPDIEWERQSDGMRPLLKRRPKQAKGGGGGEVILATIKSGIDAVTDYLLCEVEGESGSSTKVAKAYLLRVSPFNDKTVNSVSYHYINGHLRTAIPTESPDYTEYQEITPSWNVGDIIYVSKNPSGGTGVSGADYLDLNPDGRCWAQTFV